MLDINVKTIDGQSRAYSVPDNYTVKQFKEKIFNSLHIPVDRQRLIFQGRELKDGSLLNEYDVDGKTLHLVQRLPPAQAGNRPRANTDEPATNNSRPNPQPNLPSFINHLFGIEEIGPNRVTTSNNGNTNEIQFNIDLRNHSQTMSENDIRRRIRNIRRFLELAEARLNRLRQIQSGDPLFDTPNSTIIVGSIQTTTTLNYGNNIIGIETNQQNIRGPIDPSIFSSFTSNTNQQNVESPQESSTETQTENNQTSNQSNITDEQEANLQSQSIGVEVFAEINQSAMDVYARFLPYLQHFNSILLNDANELPESPNSSTSNTTFNFPNLPNNINANIFGAENRRQRFCNNINDMMHILGHLFHNLSDLHVNIRDRPPRRIHTMNSMLNTNPTLIRAALPVEATIQIPLQVLGTGANLSGQNPTLFRPRSSQSFSSSPQTPPGQQRPQQQPQQQSQQQPQQQQTQQQPQQQQPSSQTSNSNTQLPPRIPMNFGPFANNFISNSPFNSFNNLSENVYDQYLRCNSYYHQNDINPQRRRHPAGDHRSTTTNNQQQTGQNNLMEDLRRMFPNFGRTSNMNLSTQQNSGDIPNQTPTNFGSNSNSGTLPTTNVQQPLSRDQADNPIARSLVEAAAYVQNNLINRSSSTNGYLDQNERPVDAFSPGNIFRETLNLLNPNNQNENRLNQPLREFMRLFGSDEYEEVVTNSRTNQPSMVNIFNIFFSSLTVGDMIDLARGQNRHKVFESARIPVRNYLRNQLTADLGNNSLNEENLNTLVNRIYTDIIEDENGFNIDLNKFDLVNQKIDFKLTFENMVKNNLKLILRHIFDESFDQVRNEQEESWSSLLFDMYLKTLNQIVNLFRHCVKNADTTMLQLTLDRLRSGLTSSSSNNFGPLVGSFETFLRNHIQETLVNVQTNFDLIKDLIHYKPTSSNEVQNQSSLIEEDDNKSIDQFDSASSTISTHSMDVDNHFEDAKSKENIDINERSILKDETNTNVLKNFNDNWIPIIKSDIEKQKKLNEENKSSERIFSDAYMSGMPAKKRRLYSKDDLTTEKLLKNVLTRTFKNIKVKSDIDEDKLIDEMSKQSNMIENFESELDTTIAERLKNDKDFQLILQRQEKKNSGEEDNNLIYNNNRFPNLRKRLDKK